MKLGLKSTVGASIGITGPNTTVFNGYFIYGDYLTPTKLFDLFELRFAGVTFQNGGATAAVSRLLSVRTCESVV
jgi:hypothetical protein